MFQGKEKKMLSRVTLTSLMNPSPYMKTNVIDIKLP